MKAIKITIGNAAFLLPGTHSDYEFPAYVESHKDLIKRYISANEEVLSLAATPFSTEMDEASKRSKFIANELKEFKHKTGIIGFPFNMHDADLYAHDRKVEIVMTVDI